jgi:hypothetical protein
MSPAYPTVAENWQHACKESRAAEGFVMVLVHIGNAKTALTLVDSAHQAAVFILAQPQPKQFQRRQVVGDRGRLYT